jgi:hypothetical protein
VVCFRSQRVIFRSMALVLPAIMSLLILADPGISAQKRTSKKAASAKPAHKSTAKPALDSALVVKQAPAPPPGPLPPFAQLDQWEQRSSRGPLSITLTNQVARSVERLCQYYGVAFDITSPLRVNLSAHEWPSVFADQKPNPKRQRVEIENLLTLNSLRFRPLITAEPGEMADVMARAVADGAPILLNAPAAPIIYGFDRREADAWWMVQWREGREIVYESERTRTLVWWTDDPSANIAWAVTGPDSNAASSRFQADDYAWLRTLNASVAGNERQGVLPYPLSIRGFRDKLADAPALPELLTPVDSLDPLGIRRALATRDYTVDIVERLTAMAVDTALSQPLRLALYFYHNATQSLDRLDSLLYDAASGHDILLLSQANWANPSRKDQAVATLTQMLEWEKQASQQVAIALQVREKGTR